MTSKQEMEDPHIPFSMLWDWGWQDQSSTTTTQVSQQAP
jgi:hypothetical protein